VIPEKAAWYLARSSGWVAFVLLAVTVVWGILGVSRLIERRGLPRWLLAVHRHVALLTVVFTGVHLAALVADNYSHIAWKEILLPMAIDYRPGAVAWGIVAMYLLVAVQVSSWLRHRLPTRVWRGIHLLSYPALWFVAVHGLQAGTDVKHLAVRVGAMAVIAIVSFITLMRTFVPSSNRGRRRTVTLDAPDAPDDIDELGPTLVADAPAHV
jgi:predicted ferric reductase